MAKKGGRRGKGSLINRVANLGLLWIAVRRPIESLLTESPEVVAERASMGLTKGAFSKQLALDFYGGAIGALVAFEVKKVVMKKLGRKMPF